MCGRYTLYTEMEVLEELYPLFDLAEDLQPRYNIAPTQQVFAVRQLPGQQPKGVYLRWGLIPPWAEDMKIGYKMINAKGETVAEKPAFRAAFKARRCLVFADGFYEWETVGKTKIPHWIHRKDRKPFTMAGLWETWKHEEQAVESCTLITTSANAVLEPFHDRMPVILDPADHALWLDPQAKDVNLLKELIRPYDATALTESKANPAVNNVRNQGPELLTPPKS